MTNDKENARAYGIFGSVDLGDKGPSLLIPNIKTCLFSGKFHLHSKDGAVLGPLNDAFAKNVFGRDSVNLNGRMLEDKLRFHVVGGMHSPSVMYGFELMSKSDPLIELAKWKGVLKYRGVDYKARCTTQPLSEDGNSTLI